MPLGVSANVDVRPGSRLPAPCRRRTRTRCRSGAAGKILPEDLSDGSTLVLFTAVADTAAYAAGSIVTNTEDPGPLGPGARRAMSRRRPRARRDAHVSGPEHERWPPSPCHGPRRVLAGQARRAASPGHTGASAGTGGVDPLAAEAAGQRRRVLFNRDLGFTGDDATRFLIDALYLRVRLPGVASSPAGALARLGAPNPRRRRPCPDPSLGERACAAQSRAWGDEASGGGT